MSDIDKLAHAEEATAVTHIWLLRFVVLSPISDDGPMWIGDELCVAGNDDPELAIAKLKEHVYNEEEYGVPIKGFKLTGLKLLAEADI